MFSEVPDSAGPLSRNQQAGEVLTAQSAAWTTASYLEWPQKSTKNPENTRLSFVFFVLLRGYCRILSWGLLTRSCSARRLRAALLICLLLGTPWGKANAQDALPPNLAPKPRLPEGVPGGVAVHSRSGQFVVHSPFATPPTLARLPVSQPSRLVSLEPDPLAVSCERIKDALLRELGAPDRWQGQIHLWLRPGLSLSEPLRVVSTRFADRWQHGLQLPEQIEATALVRLVVQLLLTEIATRSPGPNAPEFPIWLVEGLTGRLLARPGPDLVLEPNPLFNKVNDFWGQVLPSMRHQRPADVTTALRRQLQSRAPLTFTELSLPTLEMLAAENLDNYRACAQLLVGELLRLPNGPQTLWAMLQQLTQHLNWQTAFLRAYQAHFPRLLDVEKWWALSITQFTGRDEANAWPLPMSLLKLQDVLQVSVEIRTSPNELPRRVALPLQQVLGGSEFAQQSPLLRLKLRQLDYLRARVPPELVPLVSNYLATLQRYSEQGALPSMAGGHQRQGPLPARALLRQTLRALDELDRQRAKLAPPSPAPVESPAGAAQ